MSVRSFFDTNVLVYTDDKGSPAKQRRALELVADHQRFCSGVVSMQVLQKYFVTVTRKLSVEAGIARRKVELLSQFDVAAAEVTDILAAIDLHVFTESILGCPYRPICQAGRMQHTSVGDIQGHREVEGVRIVNPFVGSPKV